MLILEILRIVDLYELFNHVYVLSLSPFCCDSDSEDEYFQT